jgi:hypothetical protein
MNEEQVKEYLRGLKAGERVVETTKSAMLGCRGTIYFNESGSMCVMWDGPEKMGTSVTWGTRRI